MLESEWFEKKTPQRKNMVCIPKAIVDFLKLARNDKLAIKINYNENEIIFPTQILTVKTNTSIAYRIPIPLSFRQYFNQKNILIKIIKLDIINSDSDRISNNKIDITCFNYDNKFLVTEWLNKNTVLIWNNKIGKRCMEPVLVSRFIEIEESLIKYLGLYFAEGNKTRHYRIYASSKDIAKLAMKNYKKIINDKLPTARIQFTEVNTNKFNMKINAYWSEFSPCRVMIKDSIAKHKHDKIDFKYNKFGTLLIDDTRKIPRILHMWLIEKLLCNIEGNRYAMKNFLKGVMLGDGYVNHSVVTGAFASLGLATNKQDVNTLERICSSLNLNYSTYRKKGNENDIHMEIRNYVDAVYLFYDGLFKEFPKRRNKLKYHLKKRIETTILDFMFNASKSVFTKQDLKKNMYIFLSTKAGKKLLLHKLIKIKKDKILFTDKGKEFGKLLSDVGLI